MATKKSTSNGGHEAMEHVFKSGAETFKNGFEQASKSYDRWLGFAKENMEAMMKATTTYSKAVEQINSETLEFSKRQMEDGVAAWKAVLGAKNVQEAWEVQSDYTKSAMDAYIAQVTKVNDMVLSTAKHAAEPLNARLAAFSEIVKESRVPFANGFQHAAE